jgi:hypothetical protein
MILQETAEAEAVLVRMAETQVALALEKVETAAAHTLPGEVLHRQDRT